MSCISPFLPESAYNNSLGFVDGRFCSTLTGVSCCLPCPLTEWVYPDSFSTLTTAADWIAVISTICCVALLVSWLVLPVDKTHRHYLSICLTSGVLLMNFGFVIPLAARVEQCADAITPNGMKSNNVCAASGTFLILGGWAGIMWVFLRSLSLHLQICWQVVVGRTFMWVSHATGWGIPITATVLAIVFSGVSFRFGTTCHVNHANSLADIWIPMLCFAGLTIVVQLVTFGYCIKVYLASLTDNSASTEGSGLPSYSNSIRTMTPRQAYRRVRRVIQLQWRGIAIVLIIVTDVIFFSIIFVFQDNTVAAISEDPAKATTWLICLATHNGDKNQCLQYAAAFTVNEATIGAVLILLAMNGIWLLILLGRWSMVHGWMDLVTPASKRNKQREFVSVDARLDDLKKDTRSYEMLSRDASSSALEPGGPNSILSKKDHDLVTSFSSSSTGAASRTTPSVAYPAAAARSPSTSGHLDRIAPLSPLSSAASPHEEVDDTPGPLMDLNAAAMGAGVSQVHGHGRYGSNASFGSPSANSIHNTTPSGRRTPDYFGQTARYNAPARSFSNPRPPTSGSVTSTSARWDARDTFARATSPPNAGRTDTMRSHSRFSSRNESRTRNGNVNSNINGDDYDDIENRHPLGMNRI